jgi:UDP-N-acetylglucosamine 2-epimerase (non-hydrolysing)
MVGAKLGIRTVHLEAGLRSRDRSMPEEINRLVTDAIADVLWTPSPDADANLAAEGVPADKVTRVGNIMLDSFELVRPQIEIERAASDLPTRYGVVTLHRPSNVDDPDRLRALVEALVAVQSVLPLIFPVHPRTAQRLQAAGLRNKLEAAGIRITEPVPYIRFMSLVIGAAAVITDSGGVQEETTYLGIPCLTLRENTERPITVDEGTNRLTRAETLLADLRDSFHHGLNGSRRPEHWDGRTAARCLADLRRRS